MAEMTPRQMVKALLRGEPVSHPLLLPVVFSLGARLENLALRDFLGNPTKIANALRQICGTMKPDGLMCYWDPSLEHEAWGKAGSAEELRRRIDAAGGIANLGRVRTAIEVLQRLKVMLKDEPALMIRVTGPATLARFMTPGENNLEFAAGITAELVKAYLEAGADVIFVAEQQSPGDAAWEQWQGLLDPLWNVIRFYEALPVLWMEEPDRRLAETSWECAPCFDKEDEAARASAAWRGLRFGGVETEHSEADRGSWARSMAQSARAAQAAWLTCRDVQEEANLKEVTRNLLSLRGQISVA